MSVELESPEFGSVTSLVGEGAQAAPLIIESPPTPCIKRKSVDSVQGGVGTSSASASLETEGKGIR